MVDAAEMGFGLISGFQFRGRGLTRESRHETPEDAQK